MPVGTPVSESQAGLLQPIASAGPYDVDTHAAGSSSSSSPFRTTWRTAPQLDGIVFAVAGDPERAAVLVEQGRADLVADVGEELSPAFSFDGRLERQFGQEDCLSSTGEQPVSSGPPSNLIRFISSSIRAAACLPIPTCGAPFRSVWIARRWHGSRRATRSRA